MRDRPDSRRIAALVCLLLCLISCSGCKYSAKLHELVQDRYEHKLSLESAKEYINTPEAETSDEELAPIEQSEESEREIDESPQAPELKPQAESSSPARDLTPDETARRSARQVTKPSSSQATDTPNTSQDAAAGNPASGSQEAGQGEGTGGAGENGTTIVPGPGGVRQIVDARGSYVEVPENVESVAASGDVAALLCLVGGEGTIRASSEQFKANPLLPGAVAESVQALWAGDGTGLMQADAFQALLDLHPQVCVELSGRSAFSEEQIGKLQEGGIAYVVLPALDSLEGIKSSVRLAGQLVGDKSASGGADGNALAETYGSYVDALLTRVASAVQGVGEAAGFGDINASGDGYYNGKYTTFVQGWDAGAGYRLTFNGTVFAQGTGAAYTGNHLERGTTLMSQLMSVAGLENTMEIKNTEIAPYLEYVSPVVPTREKLSVDGGAASKVNTNRIFQYGEYGLGDAHFPGIVVNGSGTAAAMRQDALWAVYSLVSSADGTLQVNGFTTSDGSIVGSSAIAPYDIFVNPEGLSAWSGSAESALEPLWLAWKFYGAYAEEDVMREVQNFYSTFYRITLSEEQARNIINR